MTPNLIMVAFWTAALFYCIWFTIRPERIAHFYYAKSRIALWVIRLWAGVSALATGIALVRDFGDQSRTFYLHAAIASVILIAIIYGQIRTVEWMNERRLKRKGNSS